MVQLCKAHGILRDVANELTTWTDRAGHNAVQETAKAALTAHPATKEADARFECMDMVAVK